MEKQKCCLQKRCGNGGVRYRLNYRKLPGSPDIAIVKYKIAVSSDGEFWRIVGLRRLKRTLSDLD